MVLIKKLITSTEITKIEGKISDIINLAKTVLTSVENKISSASNLVKNRL